MCVSAVKEWGRPLYLGTRRVGMPLRNCLGLGVLSWSGLWFSAPLAGERGIPLSKNRLQFTSREKDSPAASLSTRKLRGWNSSPRWGLVSEALGLRASVGC